MLTSILNAFGRTRRDASAGRKTGTRPSSRLSVETLENRTLQATALLHANGLLAITGNDASETIVARQISGRISVDGIGGSFNASQVKGISVDARGGNDTVLLNSESVAGQQAIAVPVLVDGGIGNDVIVGGTGRNLLAGGAGDDRIWGNWNNDVMIGGIGNDALYGQGGHDVLLGQAGADLLAGGGGNDFLDGGAGGDALYGEAGLDWFIDESLGTSAKDYRSTEDNYYSGSLTQFDQQVAALGVLVTLPANNVAKRFPDSVDEFMGRVPLMYRVASLDVSPLAAGAGIPTVAQLDAYGNTYIKQSSTQLKQSLNNGMQQIPFGFIDDGCYARAHIMDDVLSKVGINNSKLFIFGQLRVNGNRYDANGADWGWHVAPLVLVNDGGKLGLRVYDPSLARGAILPADWAARSNVNNNPAILQATSRNQYGPLGSVGALYVPVTTTQTFQSNLPAARNTLYEYMTYLATMAQNKKLASPWTTYSGVV